VIVAPSKARRTSVSKSAVGQVGTSVTSGYFFHV
jgi:hypothetical protein